MFLRLQSTVRAVVAFSAALAIFASGCGDNLPTEADLPTEAGLAYPGSIEISRSFDEGETGTYIDGGSVNRAPRLRLVYEVDDATTKEVLDWYEENLTELGWTVDARSERLVSFNRDPKGDLNFGFGVISGIEQAGVYDVVVVVARDK